MTELRNGNSPIPQLSFEQLERAVMERREELDKKERDERQALLDQVLGQGAIRSAAPDGAKAASAALYYQPGIRVDVPAPAPEDNRVIKRDVYVDGVRSHLDPSLSDEDRRAYVELERRASADVQVELIRPEDDYTSFTVSDQQSLENTLRRNRPTGIYSEALSGTITGPGVSEKKGKLKRPTRKQVMYSGGAVLALTLGGGYTVANGLVPGITIPGLSQDHTNTEANVTDTIAVAEPASSAGATPPPSEAKLSATDIAIGDCLDPNGQGKALVSATTTITANQNYKLKTLDGKEVILADGDKKPRVEIPEAKVNIAACILPEARKDAITVEGDKVKINWDKIDLQLGVVAGAKSPTVDVWDMAAEPGVTDVATVSALTAAMKDEANQRRAIDIARAEVGKQFIAESAPAIQSRVEAALKSEVGIQVGAMQQANTPPKGTTTIRYSGAEFTGTPKALTLKVPAVDKVPAFEEVDITKTPTEFK